MRSVRLSILLSVLLLGLSMARAGAVESSPEAGRERALRWAEDGGEKSWLVPLVEVPALNVGVWLGGKVLGKPYADISAQTMWKNISEGPWIWDEDNYLANQLGHPYQGSLAFSAARSSGFGFWGAAPFALGSSLMWELLMENEPPSRNDLITTTVGGIVLGEMLHRLSRLVLDSGEPGVWRSLGAFLIDPVGGLNMLLFGRRAADFQPLQSYRLRFLVGLGSDVIAYSESGGVRVDERSGPQPLVGVEILAGGAHQRSERLLAPFDHFVASARLGLMRDMWAAAFLRGMLVGRRFGLGDMKGLYGLYGGYDFATQNTLRVTTVSVGVGGSAEFRMPGELLFLPTVVLSGVPFGAAGSLTPPVGDRDYQYGPGAQAHLAMEFVYPEVFRIEARGTAYGIFGAFVGEGAETIWYASFSMEAMFARFNALGAEMVIADRSAHFQGKRADTHQRSSQLILYWSLRAGQKNGL